jgi:hypothetical protein
MAIEVDPVLVKVIETSIQLNIALERLTSIERKQDINHVVSLALQEHHTIDRVDTLWDTMRQLNGSIRVIRYLIIAIASCIPALVATHQIWHWPA